MLYVQGARFHSVFDLDFFMGCHWHSFVGSLFVLYFLAFSTVLRAEMSDKLSKYLHRVLERTDARV